MPVRFDNFGAVFEVPLNADAKTLGYIVHNGDNKDPNGDLGLTFANDGYEVWQLQGAPVEKPRLLPIIKQ